jgi:hypothetical protein
MRTMTQKGRHTTHTGKIGKSIKKKWESKEMHEQHTGNTRRHLISEKDTFVWLSRGDMRAERK